jgi:hypothetical protein
MILDDEERTDERGKRHSDRRTIPTPCSQVSGEHRHIIREEGENLVAGHGSQLFLVCLVVPVIHPTPNKDIYPNVSRGN